MHDLGTVSDRSRRRSTRWMRLAQRASVFWGIAALLVGLIAVATIAVDVLLLAFAGILLGVALHDAAAWVKGRIAVNDKVALGIVVGVLALLVGLSALYLVPILLEQITNFREGLPDMLEQVREKAKESPPLRWALDQLPQDSQDIPVEQIVARASAAVSGTLGAASGLILVLFLAFLFALQARLYRDGFLRLIPQRQRSRTREVLHQVAWALRWWMVARLISMTTIGVLTFLGLWALGMEYALTLAILTALCNFIPYFGPVLGTVPALAVAMVQGPSMVLWVLGLYAVIQVLETYFITPLVEYQAAALPPVLSITAQLSMAVLVGPLGFILADPLLAAGMVIVRMLYVEDVLEDPGDETAARPNLPAPRKSV